ncbi:MULTISPECIES: hypothetical protein [unclassified Halomonas]|uniref:hypothetical protein n=1 Tax=unclassified Halomonas TaxID=2609666 RepID=UPI001C963911|nr:MULTISPECIES: hypothetical protein [unclassified Halomonas]MBY5925214.1 hypothetical protein [Halomonas sp. DP4Y7-2]MBY6232255.1 hypothetical protein [Halomonas sp. DP4Y7-1]|tara:strand:+ start:332 stop:496 length:165 start_codon:yes stop_codon:yes gene_type:complete
MEENTSGASELGAKVVEHIQEVQVVVADAGPAVLAVVATIAVVYIAKNMIKGSK